MEEHRSTIGGALLGAAALAWISDPVMIGCPQKIGGIADFPDPSGLSSQRIDHEFMVRRRVVEPADPMADSLSPAGVQQKATNLIAELAQLRKRERRRSARGLSATSQRVTDHLKP